MSSVTPGIISPNKKVLTYLEHRFDYFHTEMLLLEVTSVEVGIQVHEELKCQVVLDAVLWEFREGKITPC